MPFAVTHVILTIVAVDLWRDYLSVHKRYFTMRTLVVAGLAGLLPDVDLLFQWVAGHVGLLGHRGITHTLLFGLVLLLPAAWFWYKKQHRRAVYFIVLGFGVWFHVLLDLLLSFEGSGVRLFWPLSEAVFRVPLLPGADITLLAGIDAVILLAWLLHEEWKHKIRDFW